MKKIGILTFFYSNNYGGVLQALALHNTVKSLGYEIEIINYIPSDFSKHSITENLGIKRNIFKNKAKDLNLLNLFRKMSIIRQFCRMITKKFWIYRERNMNLSMQVDEHSLQSILDDYSTIIVGSDQVWNPSQRQSPIYFLNFGEKYQGGKISYAADSTVKEVNKKDQELLQSALNEFNYISVRNDHSYDFVKKVINREAEVVADPTLLLDFNDSGVKKKNQEEYILTYILGEEIEGSHEKAIEKIKKVYGDLAVYSIKNPTINFELSPFADKVFYDLNPDDWINMIKNAKFIYTDSFHGVLFSLKYHKPFLAYYTEKLRASRFIDVGKRYGIDKYIVRTISEIDEKKSLGSFPDFNSIDKVIILQKKSSIEFLKKALIGCNIHNNLGEEYEIKKQC